jgi:CHAT domain-containing protein
LVCVGVYAQPSARQLLDEAAALSDYANYWRPGNAAQAIAKYEAARALLRGDKRLETAVRLDVAELYSRVGPLEKCREIGAAAVAECRALGDQSCAARALLYASSTPDVAAGQALALEALAEARAAGDKRLMGQTWTLYARNRWVAGEPQKALDGLRQAWPLLAGHRAELAAAHFVSGLVFWTLGDYEKALEHYAESRRLRREIGDKKWETTSLDNAGLVYQANGQTAQALECYRQTLPFWEEIGETTAIADTLTASAGIYVELNNPQAALDNLSRAYKTYETTNNRYGFAYAWRIYGDAYAALNDDARAAGFYRQSAALQRKLNEFTGEAKAWAALARVEARQNRLAEARDAIEKALAIIEGQRAGLSDHALRATFFAARRSYYDFYIGLLMRLHAQQPQAGHQLAAFNVSERARARSLLDLLGAANITTHHAAAPVRVEGAQALLDADTALLEYALGPDASYLFAVTREGVQSFPLPPAGELKNTVQEVRQALSWPGRRHYARYTQTAQRLYQTLVAPAQTALAGKKHLIVVPDAALYYLPFEALLAAAPPRNGRAEFRGLPYLLQQWTVSYAPSASVLSNLRRPREWGGAKEIVAFGDPVYTEALPRLPDTAREIAAIAAAYRPPDAALFLRHAATETNVKQNPDLSRARRLHFAAHGLLNENRPQYSGLALGRDADEDGLLQVNEIFRLRLNAEIVTLSACRTGLGRELQGEGLMGLTRAFLYAGSASVAVSLWQVSDQSTADLMIDFYRQMAVMPDKAAALRRAKEKLSQDPRFSHPYYWASFVLVGAA